VRQIVINLLSNAIKFTEKKGEVVRVQARLHQEETGERKTETIILVKNQGVGIPKEALARIFSPFTQANKNIETKFGGTGLGLAIVKALVTLMKGTISVNSVEGKETTFRVTIPSGVKVPKKRGREERIPKLSRSIRGTPLQGKTVKVSLVNKELTENLERRLSLWGIQVLPPSSEEKPSVLLFEPTRSHFFDNEIVVMVGWERAPGFHGRFLRKPIQNAALVSALCSALGISPSVLPTSERTRDIRSISPVRHYRILLADDNVLNRFVLLLFLPSSCFCFSVTHPSLNHRKISAHMLEAAGCASSAIYTASNGLEAIESINQIMPDIVLMDLNMPVMGGLEAAREIRAKHPDNHRPVIIALTGTATGGLQHSKERKTLPLPLSSFPFQDTATTIKL
jgi:two-component system sensor histidine kinase/response regulator